MSQKLKNKARAAAGVLAVGSFEAGTIVLLHRLGSKQWMTVPWDSLQPWLDISPIEDVVAAALRSIALVVAYWVAGSTIAYGAARITRVPRLVRATAWATLPPIRRAIDRAIAVTITAATLTAPLAPAIAGEIPSPPEPVVYQLSDQGVPTPVNPPLVGSNTDRPVDPTVILPPGIGSAGYTPQPAGSVTGNAADNPIADDGPTSAAGAHPENGTSNAAPVGQDTVYVVVMGDNLWTISASHLRNTYPEWKGDAGEIATYWRRVIEVNAPNLQSGNPNLIYPGERIVLPVPAPSEDT